MSSGAGFSGKIKIVEQNSQPNLKDFGNEKHSGNYSIHLLVSARQKPRTKGVNHRLKKDQLIKLMFVKSPIIKKEQVLRRIKDYWGPKVI